VRRLDDQPWLTAPATRAVMAALEAAGGPDCARFVGGCVRNALIGAPVADIDIATTLKPEETDRAIRAAGLKAVPTGMAHGTVTAVSAHQPFEITTLRRDVTTDGRNATVAFTDDWAEDAARRDFRLNALYADGEGQVFDPTGAGVSDAVAGRIVFVGDPETRIQEDYLRILRFFRFFAWYGRGEPDAAALAACGALAPGMTRLSAERVSKELMTLLAAPDPREAMAAMSAAGVLAQILPEAAAGPQFDAAVAQGGVGVLDATTSTTCSLAATDVCDNLPRPNVVGRYEDLGGNAICDCTGDLTLDGTVNGADLGILLAAWGPCTGSCASDLNRDGVVNGADPGAMLSQWGVCGN
jgi:poly(A) polymerase